MKTKQKSKGDAFAELFSSNLKGDPVGCLIFMDALLLYKAKKGGSIQGKQAQSGPRIVILLSKLSLDDIRADDSDSPAVRIMGNGQPSRILLRLFLILRTESRIPCCLEARSLLQTVKGEM